MIYYFSQFSKSLLAFVLLVSISIESNACTSFCLTVDGNHFFGKNYDWVADNGIICTNLRNILKTSFPQKDGKTISWSSKYGSVTFNQYGKEFPSGGINEKGLVIELMWLDGTKYAKKDARASIDELQWIQYQLDNYCTVEEVINSDKDIRITSNGAPLHYLIADSNGDSASIEFLNGRIVVHSGNKMPYAVLTNSTYEYSINKIEEKVEKISQSSAFNSFSTSRFNIACGMINDINSIVNNEDSIEYAFKILNKVKQGDYTKWSIVYNINKRKIYFKTSKNIEIKEIDLNSINFSTIAGAFYIDINNSFTGNINKHLTLFNDDINRQVLENSIKQSKNKVNFSSESKENRLQYAKSLTQAKN